MKSNGALEERLSMFEQITRDGFARIETLVTQIDQRIRALETSAMSDIAVQKTKVEAVWRRIDQHQRMLDDHEKFIQRLKPIYAALIWLSATIGALVIALLWAIFTNQIEFK